MLTGPGSRDGRIAVWRTHLIQETIDEPEYEVVDEGIVRAENIKPKLKCLMKKKAK